MRRYHVWAGQPKGIPEDKARCVVEVSGQFMISYQCQRKRGHGPDELYCKQHAKMKKAGRWVPEPDDE